MHTHSERGAAGEGGVRLLAGLLAGNPSERIAVKLRWFLHFAEYGRVSETCRAYGIPRSTFYRWLRRFDPANLDTLLDHPRSLPGRGVRRPDGAPFPAAVPPRDPAGQLRAVRAQLTTIQEQLGRIEEQLGAR